MSKRLLIASTLCCTLLVGCGGGDDAEDDGVDTVATTSAPVASTAPTATSAPTTPTTPPLVVAGATVVVANGSIVGGSAGRMSDAIARAGFTTATPVNGSVKVEDSVVYYSDAAGAQAVAESLGRVLGGVEVAAMPDPVPTEDGTIAGEVLLLLGNNEADQPLTQPDAGTATTGSVDASGTTSRVVVANANTTAGSAGRMSETLANSGFRVGTPTNSSRQVTESIVYYSDAPGAQTDAETLAAALGSVTVEPMPNPIPTDDGTFDGDVLLLLGTAQVDRPLAPSAD